METESWQKSASLSLRLAVWGGAFFAPSLAAAAESTATAPSTASSLGTATSGDERFVFICWAIAFVAALVALIQAKFFYESMRRQDEGTERMVQIAGYVRQGANAYLDQQFKVVVAFFFVIAILLGIAAFGLKVQSEFVPFAFLTGGFFSGLAGWFWHDDRHCGQ